MKKAMLNLMLAVLIAAPLAAIGAAVDVYPLTEQEKADKGATHVAIVEYGDLDETSTNTAETMTMTVPAKYGVQFVGMELDTAFDTANATYTGSLAVKIGDGTDDDLFLTSTELASDGTEVWVKWGSENGGTITVTPNNTTITYISGVSATSGSYTSVQSLAVTSVTLTNTTDLWTNTVVATATPTYQTNTYLSALATNATSVSVTTNATATYAAAALGEKVYTAADTVDFVFTPNAEEATTANTSGKAKFYFRIWDAR